MKKTLTVNLNGRVFNIDEDAYGLLEKYLENLRIYFRNEESSDEIIADFEARIEELFSNRIRLGYNVINIEEVEKIIAQMGRPDDFGEQEDSFSSENKFAEEETVSKKLFRNSDDKMIGGVFSGLAAYFGWSTLALRLIAIILVFATSFWIIPIYLIAWLIIPEVRTAEQKLQMQGKPITVENIGIVTAEETEVKKNNENQGCLGSFIDVIVALSKIFLIGLGIIIAIPLLFALAITIIVLVAVLFGAGNEISSTLFAIPGFTSFLEVNNPVYSTIVSVFVLGIPLAVLIYSIFSFFRKSKPVDKRIKWATFVVWIIALILFFTSGIKMNWKHFASDFTPKFEYTIETKSTPLIGSGIIEEKELSASAFIQKMQIEDLEASIQIEQIEGDSIYILINGDENIVEQVIEKSSNNQLKITKSNNIPFEPTVPLLIRIKTPNIQELHIESVDNVNIPNSFQSEYLNVNLRNIKNVTMDSLQIEKLNVKIRDIENVVLAGHSKNTTFDLKRAGEIDVSQLETDLSSLKISDVKNFNGNASTHDESQ